MKPSQNPWCLLTLILIVACQTSKDKVLFDSTLPFSKLRSEAAESSFLCSKKHHDELQKLALDKDNFEATLHYLEAAHYEADRKFVSDYINEFRSFKNDQSQQLQNLLLLADWSAYSTQCSANELNLFLLLEKIINESEKRDLETRKKVLQVVQQSLGLESPYASSYLKVRMDLSILGQMVQSQLLKPYPRYQSDFERLKKEMTESHDHLKQEEDNLITRVSNGELRFSRDKEFEFIKDSKAGLKRIFEKLKFEPHPKVPQPKKVEPAQPI